jgi:DNA-binding response OmpR family regulator
VGWTRPTVLVVEDDQEMRDLLFDELWSDGYQLREARDGDEAALVMLESMPDLIITDLRMPAGGVEYVTRLRAIGPECPIIVMTAFGDERTRADVLRAGATAFFNKPVHLSELKSCVKELLGATHQTSEGAG